MLKRLHHSTRVVRSMLLILPLICSSARATTVAQFDAFTPENQKALIHAVANKIAADTREADPILGGKIQDFLLSDDGFVYVIGQEVKTKIAAMDAAGAVTPVPVETIKTRVENIIVHVVEDHFNVTAGYVDHKFVLTKKQMPAASATQPSPTSQPASAAAAN